MEIAGYALSVVMGFTLGLLGGGGSILTMPILVYVVGVEPVLATTYSLFIVGLTSAVGGWRKQREHLVAWKTGVYFAVPSLIGVLCTRLYVLPVIPEKIAVISDWTLTRDIAIMIFFGVIMALAAFSMIRAGSPGRKDGQHYSINYPRIITEGLAVGVLTGIVGAGGGFLIVPALAVFSGMPVKKAVGTSLAIIAFKNLFGLFGDLNTSVHINWVFLLLFSALSIIGMLGGTYVSQYVRAARIKKVFGWFVLAMGIFIIIKEFTV